MRGSSSTSAVLLHRWRGRAVTMMRVQRSAALLLAVSGRSPSTPPSGACLVGVGGFRLGEGTYPFGNRRGLVRLVAEMRSVRRESSSSFASPPPPPPKKKKKGASPRRLSSKERRKRESEAARRRNDRRGRDENLKRKRGLHPAAKWKRVLSQCDYWFSEANLRGDAFLRDELKQRGGWVPIASLLAFPKFRHWTDARLLVDAFASSAARKRYAIRYEAPSTATRVKNKKRGKISPEGQDAQQSSSPTDETSAIDVPASEVETNEPRLSPMEGPSSFASGARLVELRRRSQLEEAELPVDNDEKQEDWGTGEGDGSARREAPACAAPDPEHALVRHRRVDLAKIRRIEESLILESAQADMLEEEYDDLLGTDAAKQIREKDPNLKQYITSRDVVLLSNEKGLEAFCDKLRSSVNCHAEKWSGDAKAKAIGFDVEYCSLELDIRNTLPAMLQLASPHESGPVGLVWLDKFPDHGRDMLNDGACAPLTSLLADPAVLKVGVGASRDANHLAAW